MSRRAIRLIKTVSKSSRSEIDLFQDTFNGRIFVVKKIFNSSNDENREERVNRLIKTRYHCLLSQIPDLEVKYSKENILIPFPFLQRGSLDSLLLNAAKGIKNDGFNDTAKSIIAYGIAKSMSYLHKNNIIHGALNPSHVLLNVQFHPYIIGYYYKECYSLNEYIDNLKKEKDTCSFIAPELVQDSNNVSKASDIYSYGVILVSLLTEQIDFSKTPDGFLPKLIPSNAPEVLKTIVTSCLSNNIEDRNSFDEITNLMEHNDTFFIETDKKQYSKFKEFLSHDLPNINIENTCPIPPEIDPKQQFENVKNSENSNNPFASLILALYRRNGTGCSVNRKAAQKLFKNAADFGLPEAQFNYGIMIGQKPKNAQVRQESLTYIINSANNGNADAQTHLAKMIIKNQVPNSHSGAVTHYLSLALEQDSVKAGEIISELFNSNKTFNKDKHQTMEFLKKAANLGDKDAQFNLAQLILSSNPNAQDLTTAHNLLRASMLNGNQLACKSLAELFVDKKIKPISPEESYLALKAAIDQGYDKALSYLAKRIFNKEINASSQNEYISMVKIAADDDNLDAILEYARILKNGENVPKDYQQAAKYYFIAASDPHDSAEAQYNYGKYLFDGRGSFRQAISFIRLAAQKHYEQAQYTLAKQLISYNPSDYDPKEIESYLEEAVQNDYEKALGILGVLYVLHHKNTPLEEKGIEMLKNAAFNTNSSYLLRQYADIIEKDKPEEAIKCYEILSHSQNKHYKSYGFYKLGFAYRRGLGVPVDHVKAVEYYEKDLDLNDTVNETPAELAEMYNEDGCLGNKNDVETASLIKKCADLGIADAMDILSKFYEEGKGVLKNEYEASRYADRAIAIREHDENDLGYEEDELMSDPYSRDLDDSILDIKPDGISILPNSFPNDFNSVGKIFNNFDPQ